MRTWRRHAALLRRDASRSPGSRHPARTFRSRGRAPCHALRPTSDTAGRGRSWSLRQRHTPWSSRSHEAEAGVKVASERADTSRMARKSKGAKGDVIDVEVVADSEPVASAKPPAKLGIGTV